jgi:hypothetical protein
MLGVETISKVRLALTKGESIHIRSSTHNIFLIEQLMNIHAKIHYHIL